MAKQVLIFWGIKVANFCQEVLNFLGSYTRVFTVLEDAKETLARVQNFVKCTATTFDVRSPEGKEAKLFYGNAFELATKALKFVEQHATRANKTQRAFLAKFGECVSSKGGDRKTRKNRHQYDRRMASQIDIHKN